MKLFKSKFSIFAAIFAGMFLMTACPAPELTLSPSSLTFEAIDQGEQSVTIKSNASDWKIQKVSDNWIDATKNSDDDKLYVKVSDNLNTNDSRTGTISIKVDRRGKSSSEEINVEQRKLTPPQNTTYTASATPLENNPPWNLTSWSGSFVSHLTENPPYYGLSNWSNYDINFFFDYVNGQFKLDNYTKLEDDGQWGLYMVWGTYSNSTYTFYTTNERFMNYNWSTRTFDAGTFNGLPVVITIMPKHSSTGQWDLNTYYFNIYNNLRITLASTYAPQIERSNVDTGLVKRQFPSNVKVNIIEGSEQNQSPRNNNKK